MNCKGCLVALGVTTLVVLLLVTTAVINLGRILDVAQPPSHADAIVVLGGEGNRNMRTRHAIELYEAGVAPKVVFSGGTLLTAGVACSSTELSEDAARVLGLPAEAMVTAGEAQSTLDEASNLEVLAEKRGWHDLVIVTDRFHTRRAYYTLRHYLPNLVLQISAPDDPWYDPVRWWGNEHSLVFAVNEVLKLGFYWTQYGIRPFG